MPSRSAAEAIEQLRSASTPCSGRQRSVAKVLGVDLPADTPKVVALYRLMSALVDDADEPPSLTSTRRLRRAIFRPNGGGPVSQEQREYLDGLDELDITPQPSTHLEASAWIHYLLIRQRLELLEAAPLEEGDMVRVHGSKAHLDAIVSGYGADGRVYFRGNSTSVWPDELTKLYGKDDSSWEAVQLRQTLRDQASDRAIKQGWSQAKHNELKCYSIKHEAHLEDIDELEQIIDQAKDEKQIQKFLEEKPELLGLLLTGQDRYVIPQASLGGKYAADFFLADTDSIGISWWMVELETPRSPVLLRPSDNHEQFDEKTRKGIAQIKHWREHIGRNRAHARASQSEGGLGYFDIRLKTPGLVLVGRRSLMNSSGSGAEVERPQLRESEQIHVHTYDWLLERLRNPPGIRMRLGPDDPFQPGSVRKRLAEIQRLRGRDVSEEDIMVL